MCALRRGKIQNGNGRWLGPPAPMDSQQKKGWVNTSTCKKGSGIPELGSPEFSCCRCSHCAAVFTDTAHWTSVHKPAMKCRIKIGNRVLVKDKQSGIVKYIGDLNSSFTNDQVYAGVKLDDPVGDHDGTFNGKRFFSCPDRHGVIVPIETVRVVPNANGKPVKRASMKKSTQISAKDNALQSMLDKSWAQNHINSQSPSSRDASFNPSATAEQTSVRTSVLPRGNDNAGRVKNRGEEVAYSNEGDMFVEDAEGEESEATDKYLRSFTFARKGEKNGYKPESGGRVKRSRSAGSIESFTSDVVYHRRPNTSPAAQPPCVGRKVDERKNRLTLSQFSGLNGDVQNSSNDVPLPSVPGQPKYSAGDVIETNQPIVAKSILKGTCDTSDKQLRGTDDVSVSSLCYPLAPPTTQVNTDSDSSSQLAVGGQVSLTSSCSRLMSRLGLNEQTAPLEVEAELEDLTAFDRVMEGWGGDMRAWLMAGTYRKLKDALRRGMEEIQWQRKIHELETSGYYPTEARRFRMMRANIGLNRRATAGLQTQISVLRRRKRHRQAMLIAARDKLKREQEKTVALCTKMMSLPSNNKEIREMQIMLHGLIHGDDI